jgi:chorismate mutase
MVILRKYNEKRMWPNWAKYAIVAVLTGCSAVRAQTPVDQFQPLVEISAHRLMIAREVAFAKWNSGAEVEDAPREAQVVTDAVKDGEAQGLDRTSVSNFFKAQIEANKVVQYSLLANWRRAGNAPPHPAINLVKTVRPELDRIQKGLVEQLAHTTEIRSKATCRADVANAVGKYISTHKQDSIPALETALDRSLAGTCVR